MSVVLIERVDGSRGYRVSHAGAQVFDASIAGYAVDGFEMVLVAHFDFEAGRNLRHVE